MPVISIHNTLRQLGLDVEDEEFWEVLTDFEWIVRQDERIKTGLHICSPPSIHNKKRPWCEQYGAELHEMLCSKCAKWWAENPPNESTNP